jgi:hypothetical protein
LVEATDHICSETDVVINVVSEHFNSRGWVAFLRKEDVRNIAEFEQDGVYELWVQGLDQSNNAAGDQYYRISFEVINQASVTNVLNYPNPFSTSTQFVFTLTGAEQPEYFKIQIMTITGKVVKEITMDELGSLNIGRNVTRYAWDGKDTYGDQLANGVYLYRVVAKLNGDYIDHRDSGADNWIESGFGKMMLIR